MKGLTYQEITAALAGKTVLLTGHTGFKGAWLAIWLHKMGCRVIGCALENPEPRSVFARSGIGERMAEHHIVDIRDLEALWRIVDRTQPDVIFHLAAQPLVRLSYEQPVETYAVNVMGTVHVLECIRRLQKDVTAVMITTDKCYENMEWTWGYRENDRLGGHDPYSSSKACCEIAISSWRRSFCHDGQPFLKRVASARAGNVIGGGDWALDRIVPDCIRALEQDRPIQLRNPNAVRPWQHVLEPLWGYIKLAVLMQQGEVQPDAWNFGPDDSSCVQVGEIARELIRLYGRGSCIVNHDPNAVKESNLLRLDNSKAKRQLGWFPVWNVKEALRYTAQWYQSCDAGDVYALCCRQIDEYTKALEAEV